MIKAMTIQPRYLLIVLVLIVPCSLWAEEPLELEGLSIIGNQELPKTITIVPWKKALPGDVLARPLNSVLIDVLKPIDRDVFRRELSYYRQINPLKETQKK